MRPHNVKTTVYPHIPIAPSDNMSNRPKRDGAGQKKASIAQLNPHTAQGSPVSNDEARSKFFSKIPHGIANLAGFPRLAFRTLGDGVLVLGGNTWLRTGSNGSPAIWINGLGVLGG